MENSFVRDMFEQDSQPRNIRDDQLVTRAMRAYFVAEGHYAAQPSAYSSDMETVSGKEYVVLRNVNGPLAVYRVRNNGFLKRLKRWPTTLAT